MDTYAVINHSEQLSVPVGKACDGSGEQRRHLRVRNAVKSLGRVGKSLAHALSVIVFAHGQHFVETRGKAFSDSVGEGAFFRQFSFDKVRFNKRGQFVQPLLISRSLIGRENFRKGFEQAADHGMVGDTVLEQRRSLVTGGFIEMIQSILRKFQLLEIKRRRFLHQGQSSGFQEGFVFGVQIMLVHAHGDLGAAGAVKRAVVMSHHAPFEVSDVGIECAVRIFYFFRKRAGIGQLIVTETVVSFRQFGMIGRFQGESAQLAVKVKIGVPGDEIVEKRPDSVAEMRGIVAFHLRVGIIEIQVP